MNTLQLSAGELPDSNQNAMIAALKAQGFAVVRRDDCDAILLELARLKRLESAVKAAAKADYAFRQVLDGLGS